MSLKEKTSRKKNRSYEYGYIEFSDNKAAENAALLLNGQLIGGKKKSKFRDDTWCIKYVPELKWADLLQKVNKKKKLHEQRMNTEIEQINKMHNFIVGKRMESEKRKKIKKKE